MEKAVKKIIFDTDIGGDCDDTGALAILQQAQKSNLAKLLAVTVSTSSPYACGCADAINRYYDNVVPIGQTDGVPPGDDVDFFPKSYGAHITNKFENSYKSDGEKPENAVKLLRRILANNQGDKITLVVVGNNINIAGLLESGADEISPLMGVELVKEQVKELSLMGCYFPTEKVPEIWFGDYKMEAECNIKVDIKSAQTVFSKCPVPIVVSHYLIGLYIRTGGILIKTQPKNPVAESYRVHSNGNRYSWDPISAYYAVYGLGNILTAEKRGKVSIDDNGISTFEEDPNGLHVILECENYEKAERILDNAMQGI